MLKIRLPGSGLHRTWMKELFESTVRTVHEAMEHRFVGTIDWHAGRCGLATNRDLPDPDPSRQRIVCGYNPDGDPDDALLVGRITDATGQTRATLVNYACHPTTLAWENEAISPDYVGAMRETIQQATNAPALFLLGNMRRAGSPLSICGRSGGGRSARQRIGLRRSSHA